MKGDVIYLKAFDILIDYCNFISKGSYADQYSPNNVKRLIISPDCIEAHYHIAMPGGGGRIKRMPISPQMLKAAYMTEDYIPVMRILGTDRVCGSVEEVIMLAVSNDGTVRLSQAELDFASLVKNYTGRSSSVEESIKKRYKRLHAFVVAQMSYREYSQNMQMAGNHGKDFLSDLPFLSRQSVKLLNNEPDWYKHWGSAGQAYEADKIGGCLHTYFTNLEKQKDAQLKKDAIDKHKDKNNEEAQKKFDAILTSYRKMYQAYRLLMRITDTGVLTLEKLTPYNWIPLYKCKGIPEKYPRVEEAPSEGKALADNVPRLQRGMSELLEALSNTLAGNISKLDATYPLTVRVSKHEGSLVMPDNVVASCRHMDFEQSAEKKRPKEMYINMCYMLARICGDRSGQNWKDAMADRKYWEEAVQ